MFFYCDGFIVLWYWYSKVGICVRLQLDIYIKYKICQKVVYLGDLYYFILRS